MVAKPKQTSDMRRSILILLAVVYAAAAMTSAWNIISHGKASTTAIEKILTTYSLKNEGAQAVERYAKEHPLMGFLFGGPVKEEMELPSQEQSAQALSSGIASDLKEVKHESFFTAWWSWFLLSLSAFYIVTVVALERSFSTRAVIFSSTCVTVILFVVGIFAPALVVWTAPTIPMESGNFEFVVQHQVRGIAAIIWELLTGGHFIIGGFLLLFSIITPVTKASLTFFATACQSKELNTKIGHFLHTIGKWSMADVFVAAILLSLYALKFQQATKSIPCVGLYYFSGYCLLSLSTTEVLTRSGLVSVPDARKAPVKISKTLISALFVGTILYAVATSAYTYQQYTLNTHQAVHPSSTPGKLNNADLVLPAHK